jgi:polar amino acid transport system substrate-binding protein
MEWDDGSVSSLTYTSIGSNLMPKERIEVFAGSRSIVIDDFRSADFLGYPEKRIRLSNQDKGHSEEFAQLARALSGRASSMISFEDAFKATKLCFMLDNIVRTGRAET